MSSLVTNEVVMIIEVKALGQWIVVSSFVGLLALWRGRTLAHGAIVDIQVEGDELLPSPNRPC